MVQRSGVIRREGASKMDKARRGADLEKSGGEDSARGQEERRRRRQRRRRRKTEVNRPTLANK